jgi:ketosteroid isomerase-like protein
LTDAWNRRDLETILAISDPEAEWVNSPTAVEPGTRRGIDELTAVFRTQWEMLLDARFEVDRIYDRGDEIFALMRVFRRIRPESEARLEDRTFASLKFRDGKAIRSGQKYALTCPPGLAISSVACDD